MTTIAARRDERGVWTIASDSQETHESEEGGHHKTTCQKLFVTNFGGRSVIFATAGDSVAGERFVEAWPSVKREDFEGHTFDVLVLDTVQEHADEPRRSRLRQYDQQCHPRLIEREFHAIGCGAKVALALMHTGLDPRKAVEITAIYDPYTGGQIKVARL